MAYDTHAEIVAKKDVIMQSSEFVTKSSKISNKRVWIILTISVIMIGSFLARLIMITVGLLYPAYSSFKAIRAANVKQYMRWMMYWTVFALFQAIEYVADIFVSWLPFYFEFKVLFVIWLLTPYTKGASIIYRKILHPLLTRKESEIDQWIDEKQGETVAKIVNVGKSTVQGVANAALTGTMNFAQQGQNQGYVNPMVGQIGTNLISGISNMVNRVSTAATPVDDSEVNPDERFVELDDDLSEPESEELADSTTDDDYTPPTTRNRGSSSKKQD